MIDEKKINQAAIECADEYFSVGCNMNRTELIMEIFVKGAQWALSEFKKGLWKAPLVRPYKDGGFIAISKKGMIYTYTKFFTEIEWKKEWKEKNIEKWCYLSDLLPRKVGEQ